MSDKETVAHDHEESVDEPLLGAVGGVGLPAGMFMLHI